MDNIKCKDISKRYGSNEVLKNINLELEQGKIYGLIGRNGAGKTTLLSIMSAQNPASSGEVMLGSQKVWENPKALSHICFSRELNPITGNGANNMKVKEYLRIASVYYPDWDRKMAEKLVEIFELDIKKPVSKLSKGMMSMITIIVAMASKADFTFLDEPVAGLDVVARELFYKLLLEEYTQTGRTFVISTHVIDEASDIFEEVVIINNKEIMIKENTAQLLARAVHVSGRAEVVDVAIKGLNVYHEENIGRSKGATVLLNEGQHISGSSELSVQPLTLQNLFVALCGKEASLHDRI
ncbi:MAG: ABC transporter ATP-binding protein [Eubacteriales bacterium]|nr:ABC transporter ATP-binding protein [Eubacteriales bacterium]